MPTVRTLVALAGACLVCAAGAQAREVVPSGRVQQLATGAVKPAGEELLRDDGSGDLLLAWTDGRRVRASIRPDGGSFSRPRTIPGLQDAIANDSPPSRSWAPITLDEQSTRGSLSQLRAVVSTAGPVVWWRRRAPDSTDSAIVLARGSFAGLGAGVLLPGTGEPQTDGRCPPGPPTPSRLGHAHPDLAVVRPGPAGGLLTLISRDEGCGILLDELPIAADGTPGTARRLTASPVARRDRDGDRFALLEPEGRRPVLVTESVAGKVAVVRARPGTPFAVPAPAPLPRGARLGAFGLLRDGALALAFSRSCAPGARVADVAILPARGTWREPVRVNRCGAAEPVLVDGTGRAVFVTDASGLKTWSSAPVQRYAHPVSSGGPQRSGR